MKATPSEQKIAKLGRPPSLQLCLTQLLGSWSKKYSKLYVSWVVMQLLIMFAFSYLYIWSSAYNGCLP